MIQTKTETDKEFFTIPQLEKIPNIFHGFGALNWEEKDFKKRPQFEDFRPLFLRQIHSNIVHNIDKIPRRSLRGDSLITAIPRLMLIIKTADCLPVLVVDESRRVIGAVHCGWRGTQMRVVQHAILSLKKYYGSKPSSLLVALGPCIGPNCYEVGEEVRQNFRREGLSLDVFNRHLPQEEKYLLDLRKANLLQLLSIGVKRENIFSIDLCSHCTKTLPSFRRDREKATRMLSFIGLSF